MGVFDFFKHSRQTKTDYPGPSPQEDETLIRCAACGNFHKMSFRFCPFCGKPSSLYRNAPEEEETIPVVINRNRSSQPSVDSETLSYLQLIGHQDDAEKYFRIRIEIPNRPMPVTVSLLGADRSDRALSLLYENGLLDKKRNWRFADWPQADPRIGPWYHHISACVCELPNRTYHVEEYDVSNIQMLYGCPNIHELSQPVPSKTVEVIDYD